MILVDTSVWIDFLSSNPSPQSAVLHNLIENEEDIAITEIILTEILQGIREDRNYDGMKNYLLEFPIFRPRGLQTYLDAVRIYRNCRKHGKTIRKTVDCIISAICIENNLTLLHRDSDFEIIEKFAGLRVV